MVLIAVAIRLAVVAFLYPDRLDPQRDHFRFAYETGRVAGSIVQGQGFANPLYAETGPTAYIAPAYTYILAGIFKIFGIYTKASAIVALSLNGLISAATCLPIVFLARKSFGERMAVWSGWAWAFFPYAVYFPAEQIWETWLATLLLSLLLLMALHLEASSRSRTWISYGLLWGVAALTIPGMLIVLPFMSGWACYRLHQRRKQWFAPAACAALAFVIATSPWFIRNYRTFHRIIPVRDNFGLEVRHGNNGDSSFPISWAAGPENNPAEWEQFKQLGEADYMAKKGRQAREFISRHPGSFVWLTVRRI